MAGRNPLERYREREIAGKEKRDQKELKKRRRVIRAGYEPLLPALFRPLYFGMFLMPAVDILAELIVWMQGKTDAAAFLNRCSQSAFAIWIAFGGAVLLLCGLQLLRGKLFGYEEKQYRFLEEIPEGERAQYAPVNREAGEEEKELWLYEGPPAVPLRKKYETCLAKALAEGLILGAFWMAVALISGG